MRSIASNGKAKGVAFVGEEVTDDELKWMDHAGVKGVRFNFVKRLVDSTPRDVLERIASAHRAARLACRGLFRDADLPEMESFFTRCRPPWWSTTWPPGREEGRRSARTTSASIGCWTNHKNFWMQGDLPGAHDRRRPAL